MGQEGLTPQDIVAVEEVVPNMQYFHGTLASAEQGIRAWAILRNYQPYCSRTVGSKTELVCAASELNGFKYCDNWLENLLVATSMGGYRQ